MKERCKHDLLPGQCGFCPIISSEPAGQVNDQEFVAWMERFARPPESGLLAQRTKHESPQPGGERRFHGQSGHFPPAAVRPSCPPRQGLGLLAPSWRVLAS
jgi:hypothetical protein